MEFGRLLFIVFVLAARDCFLVFLVFPAFHNTPPTNRQNADADTACSKRRPTGQLNLFYPEPGSQKNCSIATPNEQ